MKKNILKLILIIFLMQSCASKKELKTVSTESKTDSLVLKIETVKSKPVHNHFTINEICDTITGTAKNFEQVFQTGNDKIQVSIKDNRLIFDLSIIDSIKSVAVSEFKRADTRKTKESSSEVIRNIIPSWCWYSIGINLLLIAGIGFYFGNKLKNPLSFLK